MEPVELMIEADHVYRKPKVNPETGKKGRGCAECGKARFHFDHMGQPPSLNDGGSGLHRMAFFQLKSAWQERMAVALEASPLPRGLEAVMVEAQIGFSTRAHRDEGNLRWMIEKALGDALCTEGYLEDDSFYPIRRYSFGGLTGVHVPGRSFTRLMLFPSTASPSMTVPEGQEQLGL